MSLPSIVIIGARRSGTTSLYNYLGQHPDITLAGSGEPGDEIHFVDWEHNWEKGIDWYANRFPDAGLTVDKTPTYLQYSKAPDRLRSVVPSAKLLVLLRHPMHRMLSDYHKRRSEGYEKREFDDAIHAELKMHGYFQSVDGFMSDRHLFGYIERSLYARQLQRWLNVWPRESMHITKSEDLFLDGDKEMSGVFDFLDVKQVGVNTSRRWKHVDYGPETHGGAVTWLVRDDIARLEDMLGRKFWWEIPV